MKLLHFCSYYYSSSIYESLFLSLSETLVSSQSVFVPVRGHCSKRLKLGSDIPVCVVRIFSIFTRISLTLKVMLSYLMARHIYRGEKFEVVHAHTLFSDGLAAFCYARATGARLVITVRSTDVNIGLFAFPHYKPLVRLILRFADAVVFVNPGHKFKFLRHLGISDAKKFHVVPNGISEAFISLRRQKRCQRKSAPMVGVFIGKVDKNKNLKRLILAFQSALNSDWRLVIAGGTYADYCATFGELPKSLLRHVEFRGRIDSFDQLLSVYDTGHIFCLPSHRETFGLVFAEALSRCLPLVYTKGEGIDGYFPEGVVGYSCNPSQIQSIASAIKKALSTFPDGLSYSPESEHPASLFSWPRIAHIYCHSIYSAA